MVNTNGTIQIANGTYSGAKNTRIQITKNMSIIGESQTGTIIDALKTSMIFTINPGVTVNLYNLTLQNGNYYDCGAIRNAGNCTVTNCTLFNNTAIDGGVIFNSGNFTMTDSELANNIASVNGGVIINSGTFIVTNSSFTNNRALIGGTISNSGTLTTNFNRFYNNTASIGTNVISNSGGSVDALNNWWGTNNPNLNWDYFKSGFADPVWWIYMDLTANNTKPMYGEAVNLTANFNYHSNGTTITPLTGGHIPDSVVVFASTDGNLNPLSNTTVEGLTNSIFTPTKSGSVTVNATLDNQKCLLTFNVIGISSVSVDSVHDFAGQNVTLIAHVQDQNGNPINQGQVTFKVGNADPVTADVSSGQATYNWLIPANWNVGNYTIVVNYLENANYTASSGTGNLTVDQTPTNITVTPVNNFAGQLVTLTANVKDYYNQPVNGGSVIFTINGASIVKSVTSGIASVDWTIPNWNVGDYVINAVFNGTGTNYANSTNSSNLTVDQTPTNIIVNPVHNLTGGNVTLTANVKDYYNLPVNGGIVIFTINGVSVVKSVTGGIASIDWTIPSSWSVGDYGIIAVFNGTGTNYANSTNSSTLTVDKIPTNLTTDNITGNKGQTVTLKAILTDYLGTSLYNKTVEFHVNNVKVGENSTNVDGLAIYNYNISQIGGMHVITAKFLSDSQYSALQLTEHSK